jgi:2-polyprenyl-6-methoxyphenol hydroxylase-like FAD-dependent oxidoreductase
MKIAVVGGGIGGLAFALGLHQRGLSCTVYEAVPEIREIGVGITLLPHAMKELAALGLQPELEAGGIENLESVFFNRYGQFIYREPRGRHAGYAIPEIGIHRGKLHHALLRAVQQRLGAGAVQTGHRAVGIEQDEQGATIAFHDPAGKPLVPVRADVVIACDGVNSSLRRQFYPNEKVAFAGINTWRGVSVYPPILTGKSYIRIGSIETGKIVIYPIADNYDGQGNQLFNWTTEVRQEGAPMNDWNQPGDPEQVIPLVADWRYDWLDVPALIKRSIQTFEYPMVDKDPVARWTFGRMTMLGDAAHPMYPRGSNGSAQALIDARVLAEQLAQGGDPLAALARYEAMRLGPTARVVETNRTVPPDFIIMKADELSGGKPIVGGIDSLISAAELRQISDAYKDVAGFSITALKT